MSADLVLFHADLRAVKPTPEAERLKAEALECSALIGAVTDESTNAGAVEALKSLSKVIKAVESARKSVKEPFLEMGRRIDATAKAFVEDLAAEQSRISKESADWQTEQTRRMREIEEARAKEAARIERERQEELRKIDEARIAAEHAAQLKAQEEARAARNEQERIAAEARAKVESERIAKEADAAAKRAEELTKQQVESLPPPALPTKAEGQIVREEWNFEVTDIWLLVRMHPGFVRVEVNRQEIKEAIARGARSIQGLRIYHETKVSVRTGKEKAIDV